MAALKLGEVFVAVKAHVKPLKQGLDDAKRQVTTATTHMEGSFQKLGRSLFSLKNIAITAFAGWGISRVAQSFMDAAKTTENYRTRLTVLLRSQAEGNRLFKEMADYAGRVPFEYEQIMASATQLSGVMRGGVDEIKRWMPMIGDLAAASGLSIQQTTEQVIRMYSAGAGAADLFRERGILAMMGFQAGASYSAEETRKKMMTEWQKADSNFKGATDELAKTWDGMMSMLSDKWFQFRNAVMESDIFDFIKTGLSVILERLDKLKASGNFEAWAKSIGNEVTNTLESIIIAVAAVTDAFTGWQMIWVKLKEYWATFQADMMTGFIKILEAAKTTIDFIHPGRSESIGGAIVELTTLQREWNKAIEDSQSELDKLTGDLNWTKAVDLIDDIRGAMSKLSKETDKVAKSTGTISVNLESMLKAQAEDVKKRKEVFGDMVKNAEAAYKAEIDAYNTAAEQRAEIDADAMEEIDKNHEEMLTKMEKDWEHFNERVHDTTADTFYDIFSGTLKSWGDLLNRMKDWFFRLLAELAAQAIAKPIIIPMMAGLGSALGLPGMGGMGSLASSIGLGSMFAGAGASAYGTTGGLIGSGTGTGMIMPGGGVANLPGATATTNLWGAVAPYLAAAGIGALGYTTIGGMLGLPQSKYSGLGAGAGAALGFALGGPIGAGIGAIGGGALSSLFGGGGDKPPKATLEASYRATPGTGGLLYDISKLSAWSTKASNYGAEIEKTGPMIEAALQTAMAPYQAIYNQFLPEYQEQIRRKMETLTMSVSSMGRGEDFTQDLEASINNMVTDFTESMSEAFTRAAEAAGFSTVEAFLEYSQKMEMAGAASAEAIARAFRDAIDTGDFDTFKEKLKEGIYTSILDGMTQAMMQSAVFQRALQPFFMSLDAAFEKAMETGTFRASVFWRLVRTPLLSLDRTIGGLEPVFDAMARISQNIQGMLGLPVASAVPEPTRIYDELGQGVYVPAYQSGTPYVQRTGLALVHEGERIVPAEQNRHGRHRGEPVVRIYFDTPELQHFVRVEADGVRVEAERREMGINPIY